MNEICFGSFGTQPRRTISSTTHQPWFRRIFPQKSHWLRPSVSATAQFNISATTFWSKPTKCVPLEAFKLTSVSWRALDSGACNNRQHQLITTPWEEDTKEVFVHQWVVPVAMVIGNNQQRGRCDACLMHALELFQAYTILRFLVMPLDLYRHNFWYRRYFY